MAKHLSRIHILIGLRFEDIGWGFNRVKGDNACKSSQLRYFLEALKMHIWFLHIIV